MGKTKGGVIKQSLKNSFHCSQPTKLMINNWRELRCDHKRTYFIGPDCTRYLIQDITGSEIHQTNYYNKTIIKKFYYNNSVLVCALCYGAGIVDWITRATQNSGNLCPSKDELTYRRDGHAPINVIKTSTYTYYYSTAKLPKEGYELCPTCHGSGLHTNAFTHKTSLPPITIKLKEC